MKKITLYIIALISLATSVIAQNTPSGTSAPGGTPIAIVPPQPYDSLSSPPTLFNYTRTWIPIYPGGDTTGFSFTTPFKALITTEYSNGFGKLLQTTKAGFDNDIVIPYDQRPSLTQNTFLPYPVYSHSGFQMQPFKDQLAYYNTAYPHEGGISYSQSIISYDGQIPTTKTFAPGASFAGERRGDSTTTTFNTTADSIVLYYIAFGSLTGFGTYYPANQLRVTTTYGQHGAITKEFYDKDNRLLVKKVYAKTTWLTTYYIYDNMRRIAYILTPKAVAANPTAANFNSLSGLFYFFQYDGYGKIIVKQVPGQTRGEYTVYDLNERPVLIQTPLLYSQGKWMFTIYDDQDRPTISGIISDTTVNQDYWTRYLNGSLTPSTSAPCYNLYTWLLGGFTGTYPPSITNCTIEKYNYYDNYNSVPGLTHYFATNFSSYFGTGSNMLQPAAYYFTQGLLVGSRTLVEGALPNQWITSWYFYDQKGRITQTQTLNPFNTTMWDTVTTQYNFNGQKVEDIIRHYGGINSYKPSTLVVNGYGYSTNSGLLSSEGQTIDNTTTRNIATYTYDELNRVKTKLLGGVEEQDYQYNIRGQLTSINSDYLENPSVANKTFGDSISYDYGFSQPRYDGGISGYQWQGAQTSVPIFAYGYRYDTAGRITNADFRSYFSTLHTWIGTSYDYSTLGVTYDANGNILTMNQRGNALAGEEWIDALNYTYNTNSDQLQKVADTVKTNYKLGDFQDGTNTGADYTYDADGNLASDSNKHIKSITYNELDLPSVVVIQGPVTTGSITNTYDADGNLVQKLITQGTHTDTMRYWGPFVYKNDSLQFVLHDEGRARWEADSGVYKYDYFVKDHLGNVRSVITSDVSSSTNYFASHELASAGLESSIFANLANVSENKPYGGPGDLRAAQLTSSNPNQTIGTAMVMQVMAGDAFDISATGYWDTLSSNYVSSSTMISALLGTLMGQPGGFNNGEDNPSVINAMFSTTNYNVYEGIKDSIIDPTAPRAFINYLVYDNQMNLIPDQSGAIQVSNVNAKWVPFGTGPITVNQSGYVAIYMSNEQAPLVYMDDLSINYYRGRLLQSQLYYPFGLDINEGETTSPDNVHNQYLYQDKKKQDELGYDLYDFHARQYDAQIGRFWGIDPANQFPSGYTGMGNDPANNVDPTGMIAGAPYGYNPTPGQFPQPNSYDQPPDLEALFGDKFLVAYNKDGWVFTEMLNEDGTTTQGLGFPGGGSGDQNKSTTSNSPAASNQQVPTAFIPFLTFPKGQSYSVASNKVGPVSLSTVRDYDLFDSYVGGTGPTNLVFLQDNPMTQDMMSAPGVNLARAMFYAKYQDQFNNGTFNNTATLTNVKAGFGLNGFLRAGFDITQQFIGDYRVDIYTSNDAKNLLFVVSDSKSLTSLLYHIPFVTNIERDPSKQTPFGNTYQNYIWSEPVNFKANSDFQITIMDSNPEYLYMMGR